MSRRIRIPHAVKDIEVRQAFQRLTELAETPVIAGGSVGEVLIGQGLDVDPIWVSQLTALTLLTVDNITINGAVITSDSGAISFDNENISTTGTVAGVNVTSGADPGHTHSIYTLPDGTRPFVGTVGGIDPVASTDLTTKDYVDTAILEIVYTPDSLTLNTGGYEAGDVDSVKTLSDGNTYDVSEVGGVPGFDIEFDFSAIESFSRMWIHVLYRGSGSHVVNVDIWNYDSADWDTLTTFTLSDDIQFIDLPVDDTDRLSSGDAIVRLYHITSGNAAHDVFVDYVALANAGFGSSNEHGSLVGLADDDHAQYLLVNGARELTGDMTVTALKTIDGRDLSIDGSKLDGIESLADVTDATNVASAGAAMSGGAFHNGFSDLVANEHIDWTDAGDNFQTSGRVYLETNNRTYNSIYVNDSRNFGGQSPVKIYSIPVATEDTPMDSKAVEIQHRPRQEDYDDYNMTGTHTGLVVECRATNDGTWSNIEGERIEFGARWTFGVSPQVAEANGLVIEAQAAGRVTAGSMIKILDEPLGSDIDNTYGILDLSQYQWWLADDDKKLQFGATKTDLQVYSDGTNGAIDCSETLNITTNARGARDVDSLFSTSSEVDHNATTNFAENEHLELPGTLANVLSDHDLVAHTALGLFDQSSDVDHNATTNFVTNEHINWTVASDDFYTTGGVGIGTASTIFSFAILYEPADASGAHAFKIDYNPIVTGSGEFNYRCLSFKCLPEVPLGAENSGQMTIIRGSCIPTEIIGTLGILTGWRIGYGLSTGSIGTVESLVGLEMVPYNRCGETKEIINISILAVNEGGGPTERVSGADGVVSGTSLDAASVGDWSILGIDTGTDICVLDGTSKYRISSVSAGSITLDEAPGDGAGIAYSIRSGPGLIGDAWSIKDESGWPWWIAEDNARLQLGRTATDLELYSNGTNGNIKTSGDLILNAGGELKFGTHSGIDAEAVTGFITIKDINGNTRKLAVVS